MTRAAGSSSPRRYARGGPILPIAAFAALGLATSIFLIPRDYERALQAINAGDLDHATLRLREMWGAGDHGPSVASALASTLIDSGDPAGSIAVLEDASRIHPEDMGMLDALAGLYQGTGRLREYAQTLERQQAAAPDRARQERLADVYRTIGDSARQRAATWGLLRVYRTGHSRLLELARLEAAEGNARAALDALDLKSAFLGLMGPDAISLAISLELGLRHEDAAVKRGREWIAARQPKPAAIATMANVFHAQRRPDLLARLLEPLAVRNAPLAVFEELGYARFKAGNLEGARAILADLRKSPRSSALHARLRLALSINATDHVVEIGNRLPFFAIPAHLQKGVASAALVGGDLDLLRKIAHRGGRALFAQEPVFAARIMVTLRRYEDAENWLAIARRAPDAGPESRLGMAHVDLGLGRRARALHVVRSVFGDPPEAGMPVPAEALPSGADGDLSADALMLAATLYIDLGIPNEGRVMLGAFRKARPSPEADRAWAIAAAASGVEREVSAWQHAATAEEVSPQFLRDLTARAMAAGAHDLAASTARRLVALRGNDMDKMLMATASLAASRPLPQMAKGDLAAYR